MKTVINVHDEVSTTNYVDAHTGEILDEKKSESRSVMKQEVWNKRADLFFNVYNESWLFTEMLALSKAELSTLLACASASQPYSKTMLERFAYPGNMLLANAQFRQWVCSSSNLADSSVKEALSSLVKKGFMLRDTQAKGVYYLNANIIFKGYSGIRTRLLNAPTYSESINPDDQETDSWSEAEYEASEQT